MISILDINGDGIVDLSDAQLFQQWASGALSGDLTDEQRQRINNISSYIDFGLDDNELHAQIIYDLVIIGGSDEDALDSLLNPKPVCIFGDNRSYFDISLPMIETAVVIKGNIHYLCPVNQSQGMNLKQKDYYSYDQSEIAIPLEVQNGDCIIIDYQVWRVEKVQKQVLYWKARCKDIKGVVY